MEPTFIVYMITTTPKDLACIVSIKIPIMPDKLAESRLVPPAIGLYLIRAVM